MLARRAAHLSRSFRLVALSMGVPAVWMACSAATETPDAGSALPDASTGADVVADTTLADEEAAAAADSGGDVPDGSIDATVEAARDANEMSCWAVVTATDAAPDAEEVCFIGLPCGLVSLGLTTIGATCQVTPALPDGAPSDPDAIAWPVCTLTEGQGCTDGSPTEADAAVQFNCIGCPTGGGRRPLGLRLAPALGETQVGAYFARLAQLEAASVRAFELLFHELVAHAAPASLQQAARASARDEVRHARMISRLARRFGAAVPVAPPPRRGGRPPKVRSLAVIARENAVEGCIRETFGAMINAWQASNATDAEVRAVMAQIADDELRHAALSWEVAAWAEAALSPASRRRVARARAVAIGRLELEVDEDAPASVRAIAGLPDRVASLEMLRGLSTHLWAA